MTIALNPEKVPESVDLASFDRANRIFFRLYQTSNLLHKVGTRSVAGFGATTQQWAVIGALAGRRCEEPSMTVKDLIDYLMVSRQTITPLLARLISRGWIQQSRSGSDARIRYIQLTALGWQTWRAMQLPIADFYAKALFSFTDEEELLFRLLLDKLKTSMAEI